MRVSGWCRRDTPVLRGRVCRQYSGTGRRDAQRKRVSHFPLRCRELLIGPKASSVCTGGHQPHATRHRRMK
ncbi:hypothetical protein KCP78_09105 [Salmonella enterica subsp. enterica]|nr:hypothetical protein KCP78_09105 [Salmonella enterica subsp. enterica]